MTYDIKVRNGIWDLNADFEDCETDEVIKEHIKRTLLMTDECCSLNQNTFAGFNFDYIATLMSCCNDIFITGNTANKRSKRAYLELYNIYKNAIESVEGVKEIKELSINKGNNNTIQVKCTLITTNNTIISI